MVDSATRSLILDLLEWLSRRERPYEEVMDAWRTSCPRLPVWEDANDCGFVTTEFTNGRSMVKVTSLGRTFLTEHRPLDGEIEHQTSLRS